MSEFWPLLAMFLIFYFLEGIWRVPSGTICFFRGLLWQFRVRLPFIVREDSHWGLDFPTGIVSTGERYITHTWPISVSPAGVSSRGWSSEQVLWKWKTPERFLFFNQISSLERNGCRLVYDGSTFVFASSADEAERLLAFLQELSRLKPLERVSRIRNAVAVSLDSDKAQRRLEQSEESTSGLKVCTLLTFSNLFILGPIAVVAFGLDRAWMLWAGMHIFCVFLSFVSYMRLRRITQTRKPMLRPANVILGLLFPTSAARFAELVTRGFLSDMHSLAVAPAVLSKERSIRHFRSYFVALLYARFTPDGDVKSQTELWFKDLLVPEVEHAVDCAGLGLAEIMEPPTPDIDAERFCPRCHAQYRAGITHCIDCPGIDLVRFKASPGAAHGAPDSLPH